MPEYRRHYHKGGSYFFTIVTHQRQKILLNEDMRLALRESIGEISETLPFKVDAWVLLPDHLHCIWTLPAGDADYSSRWKAIKIAFAKTLPKTERLSEVRERKGERGIWQRRFWEHTIRDDRDYAAHVDYIHINPLKHGLVQRVSDWPYSSFHRFVAEGSYPNDWAGSGMTLDVGERGE